MAGRLKNPTHERFAQLIALGHISQHAAYLEALGEQKTAHLTHTKQALAPAASRLATSEKVSARVQEIRAENERECRWNRRQLLDFYCDVLETGAGDLKPSDRLCQGIERTTTTTEKSTIVRERLLMPSKVDCADGLRKMLGWDKKSESEATDDITELLVMIRRKSSNATEIKQLPENDQTMPMEALPLNANDSVPA